MFALANSLVSYYLMGGRRPRSTAEILGSHRDPRAEARLQAALRDQNPDRIAEISSDLAGRAVSAAEVQKYFQPFLPFIKDQLTRAGPIDSATLRRIVRAEWAEIKRAHKLEVRPPVSDAVVQAVTNFLRRRER